MVVLNLDGYTVVSSLISIWELTWWSSTKTIIHSWSGRAPPHPACVYVPGDVDQQRKWTVTLMVILMFTFDPYMGVDLVVLNDGMLTGTDALTYMGVDLVVLNFDGCTSVSSLIFIWELTWWSSTKTIIHSKSGRASPHPACVYVPGDVDQPYEAQRR